jgi:hypothetical protein
VPFDQGRTDGLGDLIGENGLAGARLALDQQRTLQRDGCVHSHAQVVARDVGVGTGKFHGAKSRFTKVQNHPRGGPTGQQGRGRASGRRIHPPARMMK